MTEAEKAEVISKMLATFPNRAIRYRFTDVRDLALWAIHSEYLEPFCWSFAASETSISTFYAEVKHCFGSRAENSDVFGHWLSLVLEGK